MIETLGVRPKMTKWKMVFGCMLIERELFEVGETCRLEVSSVIWEFLLTVNVTRTTEAHNTAVKAVSHHMDFWRNLVAEGTNTLDIQDIAKSYSQTTSRRVRLKNHIYC